MTEQTKTLAIDAILAATVDDILTRFARAAFDVSFDMVDGEIECSINGQPGTRNSFTRRAATAGEALQLAALAWADAGRPDYSGSSKDDSDKKAEAASRAKQEQEQKWRAGRGANDHRSFWS